MSQSFITVCLVQQIMYSIYRIDGERFARINICGFSAIKVLRKYFRVALAISNV